jgi:hypothetical protein
MGYIQVGAEAAFDFDDDGGDGDEPDLDKMEEELAATQLQAHFRGYVA